MITGQQKEEYLAFFNRILLLDMEMKDVKMITEIDDKGKPIAVTVFSNCSRFNMEISVASVKGWTASRRYIKEYVKYAFQTCGVLRLTIYVPESNATSLKFSKRLGFVREFDGVLKNWFGRVNGVQLVMFKDENKWLTT